MKLGGGSKGQGRGDGKSGVSREGESGPGHSPGPNRRRCSELEKKKGISS